LVAAAERFDALKVDKEELNRFCLVNGARLGQPPALRAAPFKEGGF
jgi:hypothetical protein